VDSTVGAITITLPASPNAGDMVIIGDAGKNASTNNITVGRNGETIGGVASDFTINKNGAQLVLIYSGTDWEFTVYSPEAFIGKQTMFIPAESFYGSSVVSGGGTMTSYLFNTNMTMRGWALSSGAFERTAAAFTLPKRWDGNGFNVYVHWSSSAADTDSFEHAVYLGGSDDNGVFNALTITSSAYLTDAHGGAAYDQNKSAAHVVTDANVTTMGIVAEQMALIEVIRDSTDSMAEDAIVLGVTIEFTTIAATDD
jgi:hypothetical protein